MLRSCRFLWLCFFVTISGQAHATADDQVQGSPTLKFFYFDQGNVEWVVSAEPDRLETHLAENTTSATLFETLQTSVADPADLDQVRSGMTRWLTRERERASEGGARNNSRVRIAEGVVAYMRAHDFDVHNLVAALLRRSQAQDVELAVVHLVDRSGNSSFKLKVMLPYDEIQINKQGFDVVLGSPNVTYTSVVYALALALYEVHEIINGEGADETEAGDDNGDEGSSEDLPPPDALTLAIGKQPRADRAAP